MRNLLNVISLASMTYAAVSFADMSSSDTASSSPRVITPSAGPRVDNAVDVVISADFIYWHAAETGLDYAVNNFSGGAASVEAPGAMYTPNFTYDPGFRVGLGLGLAHDAWDVMAEYTCFHTPTITTANTFETVSPFTKDSIASLNDISAASSEWRLRLDVIDLDLGRNYFISQYLTLRPYFGLKAVWNRQIFNTTSDLPALGPVPAAVLNTNQNSHSFGLGLSTGVNTSWQFSRNWNIYGNYALSGLSTSVTSYYESLRNDLSGYVKTKNNQTVIQPIVEIAMGLGYDCYFNDDNYHIGIQLGWEFQYWNNTNPFKQPVGVDGLNATTVPSSRYGDLSLQGLDLKVRFDF